MTRKRILVTTPNAMSEKALYEKRLDDAGCDVVFATVTERLSAAELVPLVADVDGVICGDDAFTEEVFAAAPRLRVLAKWGTGVDSIDHAAAKRHGVAVRNTPGAFTNPVADTVMAYALQFARNVDVMDAGVRAGAWPKPQGFALEEKTLGLVGTGNIGRAVAKRAAAFGMTVIGCDAYPPSADEARAVGLVVKSFDDVLTQADILSLHVPLDTSTRGIINAEAFRRMKPGAFLINTARGPLVDQGALAAALRDGHLAGAGLDVYADEPVPKDDPLRACTGVRFGTHNANSSPAAYARVHENTIRNLLAEL